MTQLEYRGGGDGLMAPLEAAGMLVQSVLDAGGDVDAVLSGLLYRLVARLDLDQILEVISRNPRSRSDVPDWCERTGNTLQATAEDGNETVFWIKKTAEWLR